MALSLARQAFGREKPHSSITDWVDILTSITIEEEAYDGIPELVDSINLQSSGPAEASRALRKKLKHGNSHQQYRALVLLKALVENVGQKFANTFADGHMTDALKTIAGDASADRRVKKKLTLVLAFWRDQYKDTPSMAVVANLYKQCIGSERRLPGQQEMAHLMGVDLVAEEKKRQEKQEAKQKAIEANILAKQQREQAKKAKEDKHKKKRIAFDFETEKPKVLASIVEASQATNNLQNAIQLVNLDTDKLETNPRVQDCLEKAKQARKPVVRYIQLVENEDLIGTLIETNDRIVAAVELYENLSAPSIAKAAEEANSLTSGIVSMSITSSTSEAKSKGKDRGTIEAPASVYADLEDINFGPLGSSTNNLPAPMKPSALSDDGYDEEAADHRGTLSDYSDYDSSGEETHNNKAASSSKRNFVTVSDDEDEPFAPTSSARKPNVEDDPFADPFADK